MWALSFEKSQAIFASETAPASDVINSCRSLKKAAEQLKGTHKVKRFQSPFLPSQNDRPSPMETAESSSATSDHLPPEVARMRALHHIQDAAEIISDAMPYVTVVEQQLYASIVDGLSSLERHLADLKKS